VNPTLSAGLLLGALLGFWTLVMGLTGWYHHPSLFLLDRIAIPIQIAVIVWGLQKTSSRNGYGRQVVHGVAISVLGSLILFGASLLATTLLFPHYFKEMETLGRLKMAQDGLAPERIEELIRLQVAWQRPLPRAFSAVFATWVLGLLSSLIAAAFMRRRAA